MALEPGSEQRDNESSGATASTALASTRRRAVSTGVRRRLNTVPLILGTSPSTVSLMLRGVVAPVWVGGAGDSRKLAGIGVGFGPTAGLVVGREGLFGLLLPRASHIRSLPTITAVSPSTQALRLTE